VVQWEEMMKERKERKKNEFKKNDKLINK